MKRYLRNSIALAALITCTIFTANTTQAKTYTITTKSKPCNNWRTNKHNKHYLVIRSYLNKMEKKGGTLILKKGTYKVSNTLYVPSNVTIRFKDGVKIIKHNKTGTKKYIPSNSLFQFVRDSKHNKQNATSGYNGEKNIHLIGEGTVIFDMKNYNKNKTGAALAVVIGNNSNVSVENITFKNIKFGHFIEMDGSKDVTIKDCTFTGMKDNSYHSKEAINLDTNDPERNAGFNSLWCSPDKTPNKNVTITGCLFSNLVRGIGTHVYSDNKYHEDITITNNSFKNCMSLFGILNWKNVTIKNNNATNCTANQKYQFMAFIAGTSGLCIQDNIFRDCNAGLMMFRIYENYSGSKGYPPTKSNLSDSELSNLETNTFIQCTEPIYKVVGRSANS